MALTLSKWLKEARYSYSCSWLMPLASRVRIWFSTSLMVLAMVVSSCSQPTRRCCRGGSKADVQEQVRLGRSRHVQPKDVMLHLHRVGSVLVVKDERLLDVLVEAFHLVNFRHVRHDGLLVVLQVCQLVLQSAVHFDGYPANFLPSTDNFN